MQALATAAAACPALRPAAAASGGRQQQRQRCLRVAADKGFSGGQGQRMPKQVKVRACWPEKAAFCHAVLRRAQPKGSAVHRLPSSRCLVRRAAEQL